MSTKYKFTINGKAAEVEAPPMARLLDVLRRDLGLTGSKEGCGEGECGACTVLINNEAVCSCLVPLFQVEGASITTIEGLSHEEGALASPDKVSRLQQVFAEEGGAQCGACTPGMIVTIHALLERHPQPTRAEVREYVSGTLCRCTGYERIFRAIEVLTGQRPAEGVSEAPTSEGRLE
ncbi:MAG: (2Fe-2S)-binding protein [Vicinamibacteria bacterium]|jgi:carbon-monoxide dehydrogenase small subunit|nr:(2Fe-2S)-binding protein [Vicinamibacteria bacterium]